MVTNPSTHPLVRFAVERRITLSMCLLGVLVLGWLALVRLPLEFLPAISSSNVSVSVSFPSASPEEVARRIVRPLEDSLGTLEGLDRLTSGASADEARIDVGFADGTDMDLATVEVRDRVDRVRHLLPPDVRQVRIRRFQTTDIPILSMHVSVEPGWEDRWGEDRFFDFAERVLLRRLERREGVAQVDLRGERTREVQVRLDPTRLAAHGVDVRTVVSALRQGHLDLPAGDIDEGSRQLMVRVEGQLQSLAELRALPLGDTRLRLEDVAEVVYDFPSQETFNFLNGVESLTVRVNKASTANLLDVVEGVRDELDILLAEPQSEGLAVRIYHDASRDVRKGLGQLESAGLLGGGLAILAVFLFLRRWRTTLLVGIAIPVSVVTTFVLIFLLRQAGLIDITLNVVSLMGLVLALGMLVDNSIVVIESIYRRLEGLGEDARTAALRGASEVALPILASTVTTLCVFIPLIFLRSTGGFFASYLREVGTTVCIVMVASLIVALTVVPMVASVTLGHEAPPRARWLEKLGSGYAAVLRFTLRFRLIFFVLAIGLLWGSWWLFGTIERTFGSRSQERELTVDVDTPRTFGVEDSRELFDELYALFDERREALDIADITHRFDTSTGRVRRRGRGKRIELYLKDESESKRSTSQIMEEVRELLPVLPGVTFNLKQSQRGPSTGGLQIELAGDDPAVLELLGREVAAELAFVPGLRDVDLSLESGDDEVLVQVERQRALQLGVSSEVVARTVESALSNRAPITLDADDREVDVVVRYRDADSQSLSQLRNVPVHLGAGQGEAGASLETGVPRETSVPLETLAALDVRAGPRSIQRENRLSKIAVNANTTSPVMARRAMFAVSGMLNGMAMPPGYSWSFGRWNRMQSRDEQGSNFALLFALVLVYMLMAALFESFTHPLAIMLSIPFAFIGVGLVMKAAGQPRDNFTELGFIILVGVVVNNAIVLIDHVNRLRQEGLAPREAIVLGGQHRLRAILMTAVTTIIGLLPMVAPILLPGVFGPVEGRAATWAPVGLVILGGLTTSTFLTLLVLPTLYSLIDDTTRFFKKVARLAWN